MHGQFTALDKVFAKSPSPWSSNNRPALMWWWSLTYVCMYMAAGSPDFHVVLIPISMSWFLARNNDWERTHVILIYTEWVVNLFISRQLLRKHQYFVEVQLRNHIGNQTTAWLGIVDVFHSVICDVTFSMACFLEWWCRSILQQFSLIIINRKTIASGCEAGWNIHCWLKYQLDTALNCVLN